MAKALDEMRHLTREEVDALDEGARAEFEAAQRAWEEAVAKAQARVPLRKKRFSTLSDVEVPMLGLPEKPSQRYMEELGFPGHYPFTRAEQSTV
jgi:methylmalonyl-CoA mutase N-terminal domain/subunit